MGRGWAFAAFAALITSACMYPGSQDGEPEECARGGGTWESGEGCNGRGHCVGGYTYMPPPGTPAGGACGATSECQAGLACTHAPVWDRSALDAGGDDAGGPVGDQLTCQEDCSEAGAATCPWAAKSMCSGDAVLACDTCGVPHGTPESCSSGQRCVTGAETGEAFCALASEPDPICAGGSASACRGNVTVQCKQGYATSEKPCDANEVCVIGPTTHYAICAVSSTPDPACVYAFQCEGDVAVGCTDGYEVSRQDCGPGGCSNGFCH